MDSRSLVEYSDDEEAMMAILLDDDCEEDYVCAREGDGGDSSVVAGSDVGTTGSVGVGDACSDESTGSSDCGDGDGVADSSPLQSQRPIPESPADFADAVRGLTELPDGVSEFLLHNVASLQRGDSVCVRVSSACDQAHAHAFGTNTLTMINASTYDDARLSRQGPWRFKLTVIGKGAPEKHFSGKDEVIDWLLLNFQLGYYRPALSGAHPSSSAAAPARHDCERTRSLDSARLPDDSIAGAAAPTAADKGGDAKQDGDSTAERAESPQHPMHTNGAPAFLKEGARIEQFIYARCVLACIWPEATLHYAMLAY